MGLIEKRLRKVTRLEVIDENGRSYVNWNDKNEITMSFQDGGRTLKMFVSKNVHPVFPIDESTKVIHNDFWKTVRDDFPSIK